MFQELTPASGMCPECGGPLGSGPLGPRCARCALSLAIGTGDEESELTQVADLFPELLPEHTQWWSLTTTGSGRTLQRIAAPDH